MKHTAAYNWPASDLLGSMSVILINMLKVHGHHCRFDELQRIEEKKQFFVLIFNKKFNFKKENREINYKTNGICSEAALSSSMLSQCNRANMYIFEMPPRAEQREKNT